MTAPRCPECAELVQGEGVSSSVRFARPDGGGRTRVAAVTWHPTCRELAEAEVARIRLRAEAENREAMAAALADSPS